MFGSLLMSAPPVELEIPTEGLERAVVERGLVSRAGDLDGWRIEVEPTALRGTFDLRISAPSGAVDHREVTLEANDDEARSRELASSLSLLIDELREEPEAAGPTTRGAEGQTGSQPPPKARPRGYLSAWPGVSLGDPVDLDLGVGIAGGAHVGPRAHPKLLQPRVQVSWARNLATGSLQVDQLRLGAGLAVGHGIGEAWWVGALALPHAMWLRAEDREKKTRWRLSVEVGLLAQFTYKRLLVEARAGAQLGGPVSRVRGRDDSVRLGYVRFHAAAGIGIRI